MKRTGFAIVIEMQRYEFDGNKNGVNTSGKPVERQNERALYSGGLTQAQAAAIYERLDALAKELQS